MTVAIPTFPANTTRLPNSDLMLVHRLWRLSNINPELSKRVVLAGLGWARCHMNNTGHMLELHIVYNFLRKKKCWYTAYFMIQFEIKTCW